MKDSRNETSSIDNCSGWQRGWASSKSQEAQAYEAQPAQLVEAGSISCNPAIPVVRLDPQKRLGSLSLVLTTDGDGNHDCFAAVIVVVWICAYSYGDIDLRRSGGDSTGSGGRYLGIEEPGISDVVPKRPHS